MMAHIALLCLGLLSPVLAPRPTPAPNLDDYEVKTWAMARIGRDTWTIEDRYDVGAKPQSKLLV
jgi:hypothetical protein